jgi:hypothetical protein
VGGEFEGGRVPGFPSSGEHGDSGPALLKQSFVECSRHFTIRPVIFLNCHAVAIVKQRCG